MKITIKTFLLLLLISFSGISFSQDCQLIKSNIDRCRATIEGKRQQILIWEKEAQRDPIRGKYLVKNIANVNREILRLKENKTQLQNQYKQFNCLQGGLKHKNADPLSKTKTSVDQERRLAKQKEQEQIKAREQCTLLAKQIEACRVAIETARAQLMPLENSAGPSVKINSLKTQINNEKAKKAALQQKYMKCGAGNEAQAKLANANKDGKTQTRDLIAKNNQKTLSAAAKQKNIESANLIKASESKEVIASTKAKMAENAKIKKNNAIHEGMNHAGLAASRAPLPKVQLTEAEKLAKAKIKQDAKNDKNRTLNQSAAVTAWKAEFKATKKHTLIHTLNTIQLKTEFERYVTNIEFSEENLYFYQNVKLPPASWNLRVMKTMYLSPKPYTAVTRVNEKKDKTINIDGPLIEKLGAAILAANFVATPLVIELMHDARDKVFNLMNNDTFPRFIKHMDALAKPTKK